jgi:copper transport protein
MTPVRRGMARALVLVVASLGLVVAGATPAFAHAELVSTDPQAGGVYDEAPKTLTLRYSEPVEASLGAVRVYDGRGGRLDIDKPSHPDGKPSAVRVDLGDLRDGSYVVTWRVISADAHPVRGAFTFQVGPEATGDDLEGLTQRLLASQGGSETVGFLYAIARFAVFASLALLVGGAAFVALVWPRGRDSRRARILIWAGWIGAAAATAAGLLLQGPYAAALPLADVLDLDVVGEVFDTRFGRVWVARLGLLLVAALLLRRLLPGRRPVAEYPLTPGWCVAAAALGAGLLLTPGLAGHAGSGDLVPVAVVVDAAHVGAVALWLGGLVLLVVALLPSADAAELRSAVPRYSQLALASVGVIVATGAFQSWRQVGALSRLRDTDFGRLLVLKLLLFGGLVVVAAFSREVVNRSFRAKTALAYAERVPVGGGDPSVASGDGSDVVNGPLEDATEVRNLRRTVATEVLIAVAVLVVAALLVNTAPARSAAAGPYAKVLKSDDLWVDVLVDPARVGQNDLHVTALTTTGGPTTVLKMEVKLTQPERDIAPVDVPLRRLGPGHYVANDFDIPIRGEWQLIANALVDETTQVVVRGNVEIR